MIGGRFFLERYSKNGASFNEGWSTSSKWFDELKKGDIWITYHLSEEATNGEQTVQRNYERDIVIPDEDFDDSGFEDEYEDFEAAYPNESESDYFWKNDGWQNAYFDGGTERGTVQALSEVRQNDSAYPSRTKEQLDSANEAVRNCQVLGELADGSFYDEELGVYTGRLVRNDELSDETKQHIDRVVKSTGAIVIAYT